MEVSHLSWEDNLREDSVQTPQSEARHQVQPLSRLWEEVQQSSVNVTACKPGKTFGIYIQLINCWLYHECTFQHEADPVPLTDYKQIEDLKIEEKNDSDILPADTSIKDDLFSFPSVDLDFLIDETLFEKTLLDLGHFNELLI